MDKPQGERTGHRIEEDATGVTIYGPVQEPAAYAGLTGCGQRVVALLAERDALRAELALCGTLISGEREAYQDLLEERDELRAALAPLLDAPTRDEGGIGDQCVFCRRTADTPAVVSHRSDCPVLRRDALLGVGGSDEASVEGSSG